MLRLPMFREDEKINEIIKMPDIADELQRFEKTGVVLNITQKTYTANKIKFTDVIKCNKFKIKSKRQLIAKLRRNLNATSRVVKNLESDKKKETASLRHQLIYARSECVDLLERYNNNIDIIGNLFRQNQSLNEKLGNLASFIHLGYEELKKIQCERIEEPSTLTQLKELIESCGKFYADYCNEYELCLQNKKRNRFLKNKIIILENCIEAIKEQSKALQFRNLRLESENKKLRDLSIQPKTFNFRVAYSEVTKKRSIEEHDNISKEKHWQYSGDSLQEKDFDLSTHLNIVKHLLSDQDTLLKDLTNLQKEISIV